MTRKLLIAALAFTGFSSVTTTPALALEQVWWVGDGYAVRVGGLDLSSPDGHREAMRRIERASHLLCPRRIHRLDRADCIRDTTLAAIGRAPAAVRIALQRGPAAQYAGRSGR